MARTEKYFIGPKLLDDIRRVVGRVDDEPLSSGITRIPTRLQDVPRAGGGKAFRMAAFTSAWTIDTTKTVIFRGVTATPNTVAVLNVFSTLTMGGLTSVPCAIAKDGTAWFLIAARCV